MSFEFTYGDNYSVEEEISKYEFDEDGKKLTYWFEAEWSH